MFSVTNLMTIRGMLKEELNRLEREILATPTGLERNRLCDANILLAQSLIDVKKAISILPSQKVNHA